jgi:hypothetical protein
MKRMSRREVIESITPYDSCFMTQQELDEIKKRFKISSTCILPQDVKIIEITNDEKKEDDGNNYNVQLIEQSIKNIDINE